jgi:hypothetical protein
MFTQEQLEGIILSMAHPEVEIYRDIKQSIGYKIRMRINFRATSLEFLSLLQTTLREHNIQSLLKDIEKTSRPYPLLRVTRTDNLIEFYKLIPDLPSSNNRFDSFLEILRLVSNKHHLTQKGFDKILRIKELLT